MARVTYDPTDALFHVECWITSLWWSYKAERRKQHEQERQRTGEPFDYHERLAEFYGMSADGIRMALRALFDIRRETVKARRSKGC